MCKQCREGDNRGFSHVLVGQAFQNVCRTLPIEQIVMVSFMSVYVERNKIYFVLIFCSTLFKFLCTPFREH